MHPPQDLFCRIPAADTDQIKLTVRSLLIFRTRKIVVSRIAFEYLTNDVSADRTGFSGSQIAVVSFLKIHASFFCDFILKFIKSSFAFTY